MPTSGEPLFVFLTNGGFFLSKICGMVRVMLTFHIITLFPETLTPYLGSSILGRAQKTKKIRVKFYNPRDFVRAKNKSGYKQIDDRPFGGGPGMVMRAEPILKAVAWAKGKVFILSPRGKQFDNALAAKLAKQKNLILISGRYEGIDARVTKILKAEEISVGPYVLTGGEVPALVLMDAITRRLPGVLGKDESVEEKRVAGAEVYTRPEVLVYKKKKYRVPKILLSGHHQKIDQYRLSTPRLTRGKR